jgi:prohibitin 2
LKSVIARYNASELLTQREVSCSLACLAAHLQRVYFQTTLLTLNKIVLLQVVSKDIRRILSERALYFNILLEDVSITQVRCFLGPAP